ncbi:unnamed protein product [Oikopleura dioica]|uniref:Uncharacterized protein n=1 Tax=Oikopleura dioica TaxID=34765 RepID=E4XE92_OIKDI|nr:unnamed protein product [Oikopleura dioica]
MPSIEEDNWVPATSSEITAKHESTLSRVSRIEKLPVSTKEQKSHPIASELLRMQREMTAYARQRNIQNSMKKFTNGKKN